jgi:hypothetical protein
MNRREYLISASAFSVAAIAGCSGSGDDDDESDTNNESESDAPEEEPDPEPQNETESDPEETEDDTEFVEGTPSEILPGEDFDPYGWVYTGDNTEESAIPRPGEYRERTYVLENHTLSFEVWVFDSVDGAKTGFEEHLDRMPDTRELIPEEIGDEGYRYRSGAYFIFFREANVVASVRTDRGYSVARENAQKMRDDW